MEFRKLSDVNLVENMSENTHVLIEEEGEIKKVSNKKFDNSVPTIILQNPTFMEYLEYASNPNPAPVSLDEGNEVQPMLMAYPQCINSTFNEVWEMAVNGQPFNIILQDVFDYYPYTFPCYFRVSGNKRLTIYFHYEEYHYYYVWDEEGIWVES